MRYIAQLQASERIGEHEALATVLSLTSSQWLPDLRRDLSDLRKAVSSAQTPPIVDWLLGITQLQGVSDANATAFTEKHGAIRFCDIASALDEERECSRLSSYWHFAECGYRKSVRTCAVPDFLPICPLPTLPLRNGRLTQSAFSLFLFVRDVCDGDLVRWIDERLEAADKPNDPDRASTMREALLEPLRSIHGVSDKVLSMAFADLLLVGDPNRERWVTTGASMIAIDTLVHNFLHRTGIQERHSAQHVYGAGCYAPGGCAAIIRDFAEQFDARSINPAFPSTFPRLIQHSIWRFCAADELNICNGNRIDDRYRCQQRFCPNFDVCVRNPLRKPLAGEL